MSTARYGLPYIEAQQAQKHVTHNEALDLLDGLLPGVVASATVAAAPASPSDGEAYIVPTGGTFGEVAEGHLAVYSGGSWVDVTATFGHRVLVLDEARHRINAGSRGWVPGQVIGTQGGTLGLRAIDFEADLSSGTQVTIANAIPQRVIVLGVTTWVASNITGPDQIKVGISGELEKFGGFIWRDAPSSNIGVLGPFATYADTDILITAQDDTTEFTGGTVRLSVLVIEPGAAPT
ncbi:DUF2793 domain-containing protein [Ruegeria atlantica]|uniref:DUF2793 domain-containing protein n=1 Tax=Ruegeria atlantica TaxID=81569 RepID=UPI00147F03A7|nr:DUF2793 domain-containing protein [Ruegeria atlantica]